MKLRYTSEQRIRSKRQFHLITRQGDFFRGRLLNMWIYPSPVAMDVSKVGIIVSRKVSAHATDRNRWKRRVREVFRVNQFLIKKGKWIVLQVKPGKKTPAFQEIEAEIKKLFREGAIWQAS